MEFKGIEHHDIFEEDVIVFWADISNPSQAIQAMAQEIDGAEFSPDRFGICVNYSFVQKDFFVVTDTEMASEDHRSIFYIDQNGNKHWFKADLPQELLDQIIGECKKVVQETEKGGKIMAYQKYEITDIAHEKYPFLHRIRALRDIGDKVKAGDLGGFVESDSNLSTELEDSSWIFDDAIACGEASVDMGSRLFEKAIACGYAYVSQQSTMSGESRAEDYAYIRGANLCGHARASANSMILDSPDTHKAPVLSEHCVVYGKVSGDIHVMGNTIILGNEKVSNDSLDTLVINEQGRSIIRDPSRDELTPAASKAVEKKKSRRREQSR